MTLTVLAPLLLDVAGAGAGRQPAGLPHLEALLAGAQIVRSEESIEHWLCARLGVAAAAGVDPPLAVLRLAAEPAAVPDPRQGYWLCADPVSTTLGIDSVRLDAMAAELTPAQVAAMIDSLNAVFAADGLAFLAPHPARWYVRGDVQLLATTPLWRAIGGSMLPLMPQGPAGPARRARLNEVQMLLHSRLAGSGGSGGASPPPGTLWFWGGGTWPAFSAPDVASVRGGPLWVRAACAANGVRFEPGPHEPRTAFATDAESNVLILADDWETAAATPDILAQWDRQWFGPLAAALRDRAIEPATLVFALATGTLHVTTAPRGSPWRRWFGGRGAVSRPLGETLRPFLQ